MNSDAATVGSGRPVQLHSPESEWKERAYRMRISARHDFSRVTFGSIHFWLVVEMFVSRIMRRLCGRTIMSVKRKSISVRVRRCEKYVPSSRVLAARYATANRLLLNLHSVVVSAIKRYLSFFKSISAYLLFRSIYRLPVCIEREKRFYIYIEKKKNVS